MARDLATLVWVRTTQQQDNAPVNGTLGCRDKPAYGSYAAVVHLAVQQSQSSLPLNKSDRDCHKIATSSSLTSPSAGESCDVSSKPIVAVAENRTREVETLEQSSRSPLPQLAGSRDGGDLAVVSGRKTKGEGFGSQDANPNTDSSGVLPTGKDAESNKQGNEMGTVHDATKNVKAEFGTDERAGVALGCPPAGFTIGISLAEKLETLPSVPQLNAGRYVPSPPEVPDLGSADEANVNKDADEQPSAESTPTPRRKKTRRGRRAGGVLNRRRGTRERAAKREAVVGFASVVTTGVPGVMDESMVLSSEEVVSADDTEAICSPALASNHHQEADKQMVISPQNEVMVKLGTTVDIPRGATVAMPASCNTFTSESHESLLPLYALENAAARSIQDLRAMLTPSSSSTSESKREAWDSACTSFSANTVNAENVLFQMRRRGVLESLVALCAPFPWSPVIPLLPTFGQPSPPCDDARRDIGRERKMCRSESVSRAPTTRTGSDVAAVEVVPLGMTAGALPGHGAECEHDQGKDGAVRGHLQVDSFNTARLRPTISSSRSPPPAQPRKSAASPPKTARGRKAVDEVGGGGFPVGAGERKEWLMTSALSVLCEAWVEPSNVDCLFGMDGAAPVVSAVRVTCLLAVLGQPSVYVQGFARYFHQCVAASCTSQGKRVVLHQACHSYNSMPRAGFFSDCTGGRP